MNPSSGSIVEGSTTVVVNVYTAVSVDRVEFYLDDVLKYTDTSSPYSWNWDTTQSSDGWHQIKVIGYTTAGSSDTKTTSVIVNNVKEPPTIQSVTLQNGATLQGTVNITVTATDDIKVTKVEFYVNGVNQYTDTTAPFSYSWNTTSWSDGIYTLKIKVYDSDNLSSEQTFTVFIDNVDSPPSVNIASLQNGTTVQGTINIQVTASDDRGISKIELYIDNNLIYQQTSTTSISYLLDTTSYSDSTHIIKAIAYDTSNQQTTTQVTVYFDNVDDPPTIKILLYENQVVSGTITIPITYFDDRGISRIEYYLDDIFLSTKTTSPYTYSVNTSLYSDGQHTIAVKIYDTSEQSNLDYVVIIFDNTPPQASISTPSDSSIIKGTTQITFTAEDNYNISKYELYINNNLIISKQLTQQTTTYTHMLNTLSMSTTSYIKVVVYDSIGLSFTTQVKVFVDNSPPVINNINLYDEQVVSGTINILINASDNLGLNKAEFYVGNTLINITNIYPFVFNFDTTSFEDGLYNFNFKIYDKASNISTSSISVIINNTNDQRPTAQIFISTYNIVKGTVPIDIICQDDKKLSKLMIYTNNNLVNTLQINQQSYTYQYLLNTLLYPDGELEIKAKVYDSINQSSETKKLIKIDNTPPTINFITPNNGSTISGKQIINISASDHNGVSFVEMIIYNFNNEEVVKISSISTIFYEFDTKKDFIQNGTYTIKFKSYDSVGNYSESNIYVIISNSDELPKITITNLENGQKVKGNLEININFSDDYKVTKLEFYINEKLIDTYIAQTSSGSYTFTYNTELLSDGNYIVKIIAYDSSNQTLLKLTNITVDNILDKVFLNINPTVNVNKIIDFGDYVIRYKIFDNKGKLIYEDKTNKWGGQTLNGSTLKPGAYIYCVEKQDNKTNYGVVVVIK